MDAVQPLDYAPKPRASRSFARRAYLAVLLAGLIAAAFFWGPGLYRWANFLYWRHKSLTYQFPANHVVYEINSGNILQADSVNFGPLGRFNSLVFLHEMQYPNGWNRVVSLDVRPLLPATGGSSPFQLVYNEWGDNLYSVLLAEGLANFPAIPNGHHVKIFAGQPDATNLSHFTFDYELDGQRHTCDGWLNNSGNLIVSPRP